MTKEQRIIFYLHNEYGEVTKMCRLLLQHLRSRFRISAVQLLESVSVVKRSIRT